MIYPVLVLAYNRPKHLQQTLEALGKCELASQTHVTIMVDGPAHDCDLGNASVQKFVCQFALNNSTFKSVKYFIRAEHNGVKNHVSKAITTILRHHEAAIIVEDDIVVSHEFLQYMNKALSKWKDNPRVLSISGYKYPAYSTPSSHFLRYISS
jgi:GT2 family glycosyltransferase